MALRRLSKTWSTERPLGVPINKTMSQNNDLALVWGRTDVSVWTTKLGDLIDERSKQHGSKAAAIFPWQNHTLSYSQLQQRSKVLARAMLSIGLKHGDCVGILAGNCYEYIEVFLGGSRIGCPVVVLNPTYTPTELRNGLIRSECKLLFIPSRIGPRSLDGHLKEISNPSSAPPELRCLVHLGDGAIPSKGPDSHSYATFVGHDFSASVSDATLRKAESVVKVSDVLNLQFTSGTTGAPKAAMLTHSNLINNGRFIAEAMRLTVDDVVCCPPPLFHCFGLVIGFLAAFCAGSAIIFPSEQFDADLALQAVVDEGATALLGVPTMFVAILDANEQKKFKVTTLRVGLAAGSAVPSALMNKLRDKMGVKYMMIAYGMTETSPVTFMSSIDDSQERRATTLGRIMPLSGAKIISKDGKDTILKRGESGELCTSGYALQKGYWKNEAKTKEVMKVDENGVLWMHTGDECKIDEEGYCMITGRIKDVIIRGGENIFPVEVEERLLMHPAISEASVVGLLDERYGEVVAAFLRLAGEAKRPGDEELREWVREKLARHKAPKYLFWLGDSGVGEDFPKTGSGKHQKHLIRDIGNGLVKKMGPKAKL